jgi:hypothetical protein
MVPCSRSTKPLVQAWRGFVRVAQPELAAGLVEGAAELAATVREQALDRPAGLPVERHPDVAQEAGSDLGVGLGSDEDPSRREGAGGIAGRGLPDPEADELAGDRGLDVIGSLRFSYGNKNLGETPV